MRVVEVAKNIFMAVGTIIKKALPNPKDTLESKNFKTTLYLLIGCMLVMILVSIIAFLAFVQPVDETVIPNLVGEDFRDAIVVLQNKKLEPYINFEFSNIPQDKDKITKQDPQARDKVRIGRRVTLWVSKGVTYDRVGNYVNKNLNEVENLLKTSFNKDKEIISIKKPVNYITHKSPAGTIIAQDPVPGTFLSDKTTFLELTVSKGPGQSELTVGNYVGKDFQSVISELQSANIAFIFIIKKPSGKEEPGKVVSQNLASGSKIDAGSLLALEMIKPNNVPVNKVFGVYSYIIPEFGAPVLIKVETDLMGKRSPLLTQERYGGKLTVPYILDKDSEIVITIAGEEKKPEKVQAY
jgi:beta-lactam-binding protein with PASTA domain